jgi:N4-gp56 family major capsid protein
MVSMTNQDPVVTEATDVLGDQAGTTIDQARRDVLVAGTNVAYASTAWQRASRQHQDRGADLDKAIRFLKVQNAKFIKEGIMPSDKVGTGAIRKAFIGWCIRTSSSTWKHHRLPRRVRLRRRKA